MDVACKPRERKSLPFDNKLCSDTLSSGTATLCDFHIMLGYAPDNTLFFEGTSAAHVFWPKVPCQIPMERFGRPAGSFGYKRCIPNRQETHEAVDLGRYSDAACFQI